MNFGWFLEVKRSKNSFKNDLNKWSKIRCILGWLFGGSWRGLGCHFGIKVAPRWPQEGLKMGSRASKKKIPRYSFSVLAT
jgi:hypothetical protein